MYFILFYLFYFICFIRLHLKEKLVLVCLLFWLITISEAGIVACER